MSEHPELSSPNGEPEVVEVDVPTVEVTIRFQPHAYAGMTDHAMELAFNESWKQETRAMKREVLAELRRLRAEEVQA